MQGLFGLGLVSGYGARVNKTSQPDLFGGPAVAAGPRFAAGTGRFVKVMVPLAIPAVLDYAWDGEAAPEVGDWVEAPVGKKPVHGLVVEVMGASGVRGLKAARPLDVPAVDGRTLAFYRWVARYTLSAPGEPLRVALPRAEVPPRPEPVMGVQATLGGIGKLTPQRSAVLDAAGSEVWAAAALAREAGVSAGVVKGLEDTGWLARVAVAEEAWRMGEGPRLSGSQRQAVDAVRGVAGFKPWLLDGVTGSGKTEVYFSLIEAALKAGKQVLLLVPEIALTPQLVERVRARFGRAPMVWHSAEAVGRRAKTWWRVVEGGPTLVVGARSALFLPWQALGLVVVDEEHDPSYKQDEAFRYHGRDMAVQLGRVWDCPVVLGSATPSLESWQAALDGKYGHIVLPERQGGAVMPRLELVDLRQAKPAKGDYLSRPVREAMQRTLDRGEQVLVFLNRRGVAPVMVCTHCGARRDCPRCDATLVVHGDRLLCHHCGYTEARSHECPACGEEALRPYGPGTRRVSAEAQAVFPHACVIVADSDSVGTPAQLEAMLDEVKSGRANVIVGTQLVTKGHHLPNLTLVAVVDGDMGLAHGDLRAAERTWHMLQQVAGRAGRGEKPGEVFIQTHDPEQPLFQTLLSGDREAFYRGELAARQAWGDPPFGRQLALVVEGLDENAVAQTARSLARAFPATLERHRLLGPAPAPLARRNDRWRWRLLVKAPRLDHAGLKAWLEAVPRGRGVDVKVDVDPVSFM